MTDSRETRWFAREIKFAADASLQPQLVDWARAHLGPDGHGVGAHADDYATSTLYFETHEFDVYRRNGSFGRSKYRVRRYGESDVIFLERKFRTERLLAKRRTIVPMGDLGQLSGACADRTWDGFWFHRRLVLRRLRPLVQLSYDRVARVGMSETGPFRLTIDTNLKAQPIPDCSFRPGAGRPFLEGLCIVEVKFRLAFPPAVQQLVKRFELRMHRMSKFRAAVGSLDYPLPPDSAQSVSRRVPWQAPSRPE